jgi:uncharacterized membrane protein
LFSERTEGREIDNAVLKLSPHSPERSENIADQTGSHYETCPGVPREDALSLMNKNRLEAFTDGVVAILITLLILDIRIPDVPYAELGDALRGALDHIIAYVITFMLIGMYWVFHHFTFGYVKKVDGIILWLNLLFLLGLSFLPFPTMLLGRYPGQTIPLLIYVGTLLFTNLVSIVYMQYVFANEELREPSFTSAARRGQIIVSLLVNAAYVFCAVLAFVVPRAATYFLLLMAIVLIIRSARMIGVGGKPR